MGFGLIKGVNQFHCCIVICISPLHTPFLLSLLSSSLPVYTLLLSLLYSVQVEMNY